MDERIVENSNQIIANFGNKIKGHDEQFNTIINIVDYVKELKNTNNSNQNSQLINNLNTSKIFIPYVDGVAYKFDDNTILRENFKIYSNGAKIIGSFKAENVNDIEIDGFEFVSDNISVKFENSKNIVLKNNKFKSARLFITGTETTSDDNNNVKILNNSFLGNYQINGEINIIELRRVCNLIFSNNIMECSGALRFMKISSGGYSSNNIVLKGCKNINISNNIFIGTCRKQMIDCFSGVENFIFSNNNISVYDCLSILEGKCGGLNNNIEGSDSYITNKINRINITNNVINTNSVNYSFGFFGCYGLNIDASLTKTYQTINISDNIINLDTTSNTISGIDVRGYNNVSIDNNMIIKENEITTNEYIYSITVSSSKVINITNNNIYRGCIQISQELKTPNGDNYILPIESILIKGNIIDEVSASGGIIFGKSLDCTNSCYLVDSNVIKSLKYQNPDSYALRIADGATFNSIRVSNNISVYPNNSNRAKLRYDSIYTTTRIESVNNSWDIGYGQTKDRPLIPVGGYVYYDTNLNKPVFWNGSYWRDSLGVTV